MFSLLGYNCFRVTRDACGCRLFQTLRDDTGCIAQWIPLALQAYVHADSAQEPISHREANIVGSNDYVADIAEKIHLL